MKIQLVLGNFIALIILISYIDFILSQRKQQNAILGAFGSSNINLIKITVSELFIINFSSIIIGALISLHLILLSIRLITPFFIENQIIPMIFSINYYYLGLFIVSIFAITIIAIMPTFIKMRREKIAYTIQDAILKTY